MGNNISRILKDHFLASEEEMKNKTYFEKGRVRRSTDMVTGGTYMKLYSKKKKKSIQERWLHCKLEWGGKNIF